MHEKKHLWNSEDKKNACKHGLSTCRQNTRINRICSGNSILSWNGNYVKEANIMNVNYLNLRGSRPFPIDRDRQTRCMQLLDSCGMTITELALHLGMQKSHVSETLSGRRLSVTTETQIAQFFGVPREAIFPLRTNGEIAYMREEERKQKEINEKKKAERMALRNKMFGVA